MSDSKQKQKSAPEAVDLSSFRGDALANVTGLREAGIEPYPHTFDKTHGIQSIRADYDALENEQSSEDEIVTAGRVLTKRNNGMFIVIEDPDAEIQVYTPKIKELEGAQLLIMKSLKAGDFVGVRGNPTRTRRGELSIKTLELFPLATSLRPKLKHHGVEDPEEQIRNRVLHLVTNREAREQLRIRFRMIQRIREYLNTNDWLEVETPVLQAVAGGAEAKPFITHHNKLHQDMYMRIATELHLKELIVSGIHEKVYELGRVFRNEGISTKHNPEFTTIELYQAYADYHDMMTLAEAIFRDVAKNVVGKEVLPFRDHEIEVDKDWRRVPMLDLIKERTDVAFDELSAEEAAAAATKLGLELEGGENWGQIVLEVFEVKCEADLIQPTFVIDYPAEVCPLTKKHRSKPRLAERFELFIAGMEMANAFSELSDPVYQREQFSKQVELRDAGDEEAHMLNEEFLKAIEHGFPPTGGMGIGIDRMAMLMTDSFSIREVIAFPTVKNKE